MFLLHFKLLLPFLLMLLLLSARSGQAQALAPVTWTFEAARLDARTYEIRLTAAIASPWVIYAPSTPGGGPFPTQVAFHPNPMVLSRGPLREKGALKKKFDQTFQTPMRYFEEQLTLVQQVTLRHPVATRLSGTVAFMACDATRCLPPQTVPFTLQLPPHE